MALFNLTCNIKLVMKTTQFNSNKGLISKFKLGLENVFDVRCNCQETMVAIVLYGHFLLPYKRNGVVRQSSDSLY